MATHRGVIEAVERVSSGRERYAQISEEHAATGRQRWEELRQSGWDHEAAAVTPLDARLGDVTARLPEAVGDMGRALVEMHAMKDSEAPPIEAVSP